MAMFLDTFNIDKSSIRLIISPEQVESKITNVGKIKNSFFKPGAITSIPDLETLAEYVLTGHSFTPAYLLQNPQDINLKTGKLHSAPTNQSTFVCQQIFALDLDNHETEILKNGTVRYPEGIDLSLTLGDILDFCAINHIEPFLIYQTMSSTDECPRFRVLFCAPEPVTDPHVREEIVVGLSSLFAMKFRYTDLKCRDLSRFFYGTTKNKEGDYYFDEVTCDLSHVRKQRLNEDTPPTNLDNQIMNDSQNIKVSTPVCIHSTSDAKGDIFKQAAAVPFERFSDHSVAEGHFCCEFHSDSNPSAHIYQDNNGEYRYHCFGCNCDISGVDYLMQKNGRTEVEALEKILKSRIEIKPIRKIRYGAKKLYQDHLSEYNKLYAYANNVDVIIQVCTDLAETGYVTGDEVVFIAPASLIKKKLRSYWIGKEEEQIRATMKKLVSRGGFVRHVNDAELHERFPKMLGYLKMMQGNHRTHCSVYAMPLNLSFDECLEICMEAEDNRRKSGATGPVTQDSARLLGADIQDSLFQKPSGISLEMDCLLKKFRSALKKCRQDHIYITKDLVLEYSGESSSFAKRKLCEAWPRLLRDEEMEEIRVNKSVRWKYSLPATLESNAKIAVPREGVENVKNPAVSTTQVRQNDSTEFHDVSEEGRSVCMGPTQGSDSQPGGTEEKRGTLGRKIQASTQKSTSSDKASVAFLQRCAGYETSRHDD